MNKFTKTYDVTIENCLFTILILNDYVSFKIKKNRKKS